MKTKYYITFFGANATGKSSTAGWLSEQLPKHGITVETVGTYRIRNGRSYHTGGADALHSKERKASMNDAERMELIKQKWMSDADVVIGEGMFLSGHKQLQHYIDMKKMKDRIVLVIHLYATIEELGVRITERSGGKELTDVRVKRLGIRTRSAVKDLAKFRDSTELQIHEYDTTNKQDFPTFRQKIVELITQRNN